MDNKLISKKKPSYPISLELNSYLEKYNRIIKIPIYYEDLLRFKGSVEVYDKNGQDTLWIRTYYSDSDRSEIDRALKRVYTILLSDGNENISKYLSVDAVDYCTFGNSKPFRVKIRNILNDNYTYFYIKKADASRIYGLELEHILSPYNLNFLVHKNTLIEEHIAGIPGDIFAKNNLPNSTPSEKSEIAKEFVKFNERCMIRLLGDMRSYNYVVVPVHDFDHVVYRIRAIDFDQQCYEGNINVYKAHYFKENRPYVSLVREKLQESSITQYKIEERSMITKRIYSFWDRLQRLLICMKNDTLSTPDRIADLREAIYKITPDINFKRSENMGTLLETILNFVKRNYEDVTHQKYPF